MQLRDVALLSLASLSIGACALPHGGVESNRTPVEQPEASGGKPAEATSGDDDWPSIEIDSPHECVETRDGRTTIRKLDEARRLIVDYADGRMLRAARFDADKNLLAGAYWDDQTVVQHDYTYDANGHVTGYRMSYVDWAPFFTPASSARYQALEYVNTYGENRTLVRATSTEAGPRAETPYTSEYLFEDDAAARCARIEIRGGRANTPTSLIVEKRSYDEAGRLSRVDRTYQPDASVSDPTTVVTSTALWTYDDQGRLVQKRTWDAGMKLEDPPGETTTITYAADGSQRIVTVGTTSDPSGFGPFVTERSPYCAMIDAWLATGADDQPKPPRCRMP